jgi:hypothetical protein
MRATLTVPIDCYMEVPANIEGFLCYEIPELIRVASPVYPQFGLRHSL